MRERAPVLVYVEHGPQHIVRADENRHTLGDCDRLTSVCQHEVIRRVAITLLGHRPRLGRPASSLDVTLLHIKPVESASEACPMKYT